MSHHFPITDRGRVMLRPNRDRICSDQLFAVKYSEHVGFCIDFYRDISRRACALAGSWTFCFRLVFHLVRWLRTGFTAGLYVFYRPKLERFHIRDGELIAGLDLFQLAGIQMFEEMHVAVKFLGECVGGIAVRKEFLLCFRSYAAGQFSYALEVRFGDRVWNEHRIDAGQVESINVRADFRIWSGLLRRWGLRLFPSRLAIKRECLPSGIVIASVDPARCKICAIKENLQASGRLDLSLAWNWSW